MYYKYLDEILKSLIEDIDYYIEAGGLLVFTAWYHLKRGSCCGSRCRHFATLNFGKHSVYYIENLQHGIHQVRINATLAISQYIEYIFGAVTNLNQAIQAQEAGATFNGVESAKYGV